jgi:antitoxin ParD1/3/4
LPTRNVNLTDELEGFIQARVENGQYQNASDVVRSALRALEREEREYEAKLALLRSAIDAGDASGILDGDPFESVREAIQIARKSA